MLCIHAHTLRSMLFEGALADKIMQFFPQCSLCIIDFCCRLSPPSGFVKMYRAHRWYTALIWIADMTECMPADLNEIVWWIDLQLKWMSRLLLCWEHFDENYWLMWSLYIAVMRSITHITAKGRHNKCLLTLVPFTMDLFSKSQWVRELIEKALR